VPAKPARGRFRNWITDMVVITNHGGNPKRKVERKLFVID
jgi:hypothetical protein